MLTLSSQSTTCLENNELVRFPGFSRPAGPSGKDAREQASPRQQALTPIVRVTGSFKKQLLSHVYTAAHQGCRFKGSNAIFPSTTCSRRPHQMRTTSAGTGRWASRHPCAPPLSQRLQPHRLHLSGFNQGRRTDNWVRVVSRESYERIGGATPKQQQVAVGGVDKLGDAQGQAVRSPAAAGDAPWPQTPAPLQPL